MTDTTRPDDQPETLVPASPADDQGGAKVRTPGGEQQEQPADDATRKAKGSEAARYRVQLREAEAARDAQTARADAAQRGLVEHLAATEGRIQPQALWASGVTLADVLDDDGAVSPAKVRDACNQAVRLLGLSRTPRPDPSAGHGAGPTTATGGMADAFRPR